MREQLVDDIRVNRLNEVVIETCHVATATVLGLAIAGQRHQERRVVDGADLPGHLVAVHAGQADVDEGDVETLLADQGDSLRAIGSRLHRVAVQLEERPHGLAGVVVILDEKDGEGGRHRR